MNLALHKNFTSFINLFKNLVCDKKIYQDVDKTIHIKLYKNKI